MNSRVDTKLIRMCCDGELSPEQLASLEQYLADHPAEREHVRNHISAEKALRERIAKVMSECDSAPVVLRQRICASFASEPLAAQNIPAETPAASAVAGRISPHSQQQETARQKRSMRLFSDPQRANFVAVAASLLLVAGAILFGIFGTSIDDVAQSPSTMSDLVSDTALFAEQEHARGAQRVKRAALSIEETADALSRWLDTPVNVFDLSIAGYEFVSASECQMPGKPRRSAHLMYRKSVEPGQPSPMVSVFVVRDSGRCGQKLCEGLDRGKWCCVREQGVKCKRKVMRGTDGQLVYFLVCCDDRDASAVAEQIQLASATPAVR